MNEKREFRKQRRRDANRRAILDAAEKVFSQMGYGAATMDSIAAEAQFSKATLYRYFDSKNEVFTEIVRDSFRKARDRFSAIRQRPASAEARLREMVGYTMKYFDAKRRIARIFWFERSTMKKILKVDMEEHVMAHDKRKSIPADLRIHVKAISDDMCTVVREGVESGEFRKVDPYTASSILGAMMRGFHFNGPIEGRQYSIEKSTDLLMDFFLNGIRNIESIQKGDSI